MRAGANFTRLLESQLIFDPDQRWMFTSMSRFQRFFTGPEAYFTSSALVAKHAKMLKGNSMLEFETWNEMLDLRRRRCSRSP